VEASGLWLSGPSVSPARTGATVARLGQIPDGPAGAKATMQSMRDLVVAAVRDPAQKIRETALSIIGNTGYVDQVRRLQHWVQTNIAYVHDPVTVELVQTPQYTLQQKAGDCDDQSVLLASMLDATGHPARFIAVGLAGQPLSHVMVQTLIGQQWAGVETIIARPLGWMPSPVTSFYIQKV
jgi:transglutaminase-like putative cysteine protease